MSDYGVLRGGVLANDDSRSRLAENSEKKNRNDFVLWKLDNKIGFDSPFGKGFPGWHIECSAMSMKFLGEQFDIHTGGVDHISIHHTNEIAQSECATGKKPYVRFWMHNEHVDMGGIKMAKSEDNFLTLDSIIEKGINPLAYRFWLLTASYRTKVNFTWEALEGAETALKRLYRAFLDLGDEAGDVSQEYREKFKNFIEDDLDTPQALALVWDLLKDDNVSNADKKATLLDFDKVLGLGLEDLKEEIIPEEIMKLVEEREQARKNKDFKKSDEIREKIKSLGYEIKDSGDNYKINKI
jgi:cysteinyl-tRNA synthetase